MADAQANIGIGIDTTQALAAIRQLQREISVFHTLMAKGGANVAAESLRMRQGLINNINETGKFAARMTQISSSTETFTNSLEKNKFSMGQYFKYAGASTKTFGKLFKNEFNTINRVATERVKDLQTQYIAMGRDANGALQAIKVRPLSLDMENLSTKTMLAAQKQQLFNQLLKQGSTNLLNFGKNTQWAGRQLMVGFTIPLTIFGSIAAQEFMKLEEQAIKFRRVYGDMFTTSGETEKALDNVRELASEFTKYGIAVEKTVGLAAKVAQMGNMGDALESQVRQATRLSVLGGLEQEEALDTTISLTNAFGVSIEELENKVNFLNAAENQTILSIEDFNEAIPKAGSVVKALGGDVEDLAFFLTAMREGGISASQGANALKSSLGRLINPTEEARKRLANLGIDVVGIVEANAGNLRGTVMALAESLEALDPLQRSRAIEQLFGKFQFARMSTMFANIVDNGSQANKVLQLTGSTVQELGILAEREMGRVEDSVAYKFQKSLEEFKATLAPLGEAFLKAVTPLVEFGTKILNKFNEMGDGAKQFVVIMAAVLGAIGPVALMSFGLLANGVANLIKMFANLGVFYQKLTGQGKSLGISTEYMTQQQLEAAAVASSLNQSHATLIQTFSAEASAVDRLTAAYTKAVAAQRTFQGTAVARGGAGATKKYASGVVSVPGPKGAGDIVPAMLSPGEAIIPADMAKQYAPIINSMISGKIPGYETGLEAEQKTTTGKSITPKTRTIPKVSTFTNATMFLPYEMNQTLKGTSGVSPSALASQIRSQGAGTMAPIADTIARELGASERQVGKFIEKNPEIKTFAKNLQAGVAKAVASQKGPITDAKLEKIVAEQRDKELSRTTGKGANAKPVYSQAFKDATKRTFNRYTSFDDPTNKRIRMDRRRPSFSTTGRETIVKGDFNYRRSHDQAIRAMGDDPKKYKGRAWDRAHLTSSKEMSLASLEKKGLTQPAAAALARLRSGTERIRMSGGGRGGEAKIFKAGTSVVAALRGLGATSEEVARAKGEEVKATEKATKTKKAEEKQTKKSVKTAKQAGEVVAKNKAGEITRRVDKNGNPYFMQNGKRISQQTAQTAINRQAGAKKAAETRAANKAAAQQPAAKPDAAGAAAKSRLGLGGVAAMASVGAMAASFAPGKIGDVAQQLIMPLMMLPMILPLLANPIGLAVAAVAALGVGIFALHKKLKEATKSGLEAGQAMSMTADKIKSISEVTGTVSATELRQKQQAEQLTAVGNEFTSFGIGFVQDSEQGKAMLADIEKQFAGGSTMQDVGNNIGRQLSMAIAQGAMSVDQARSIAGALGAELGDYTISTQISGKLTELLGVDGTDLTRNPLEVALRIKRDSMQDLNRAFEMALSSAATATNVGAYGMSDAGSSDAVYVSGTAVSRDGKSPIGFGNLELNNELSAAALQLGIEQLSQNQMLVDSLNMQYDNLIAQATTEAEINRLQDERKRKVDELNQANADTTAAIMEQAKQLKDAGLYKSAMEESVNQRYSEGPMKVFAAEAMKQLNALDNQEFALSLTMQMATGELNPLSVLKLMELGENNESMAVSFEVAMKEKGSAQTNQLVQLLTQAGLSDQAFPVMFDFVVNQDQKFPEALEALSVITSAEARYPVEIDLETNGEEILSSVMADLEKYGELPETITKEAFIDIAAGDARLEAVLSNWEELGLTDNISRQFVLDYIVNVEGDDSMVKRYFAETGQSAYTYDPTKSTVVERQITASDRYDASMYFSNQRQQVTTDTNDPAGTGEDLGGSGAAPALDNLLTKLRDVRDLTTSMRKGWDGLNQSIAEFLKNGSKGFNGLANQMRSVGVGESLIERIVGMDPDEYEERKAELFVFDKNGNIVGVTDKLKNLGLAMNKVAIGEYINSQQAFIENTKNQFTAMQMLTAAGLSFVEAYEMVQDQALATAIAMGATREEIEQLIQLTEQMNSYRAEYDRIAEEEQAAKAVKSTNEQFMQRVFVLKKLSKEGSKYTDDQISAILNDPNLAKLYLDPSISSEDLKDALEIARREADLKLRIAVATEEGKKGIFNEAMSEIQSEFSRQESKIDIQFRLDTKDDQDVVAKAQDKIAELQVEIDDYQAELRGIADQEDVINEKYEDRFAALEEVAAANERIQRIRSAELDVADALSRGDIAAAARAQQQLRAAEAQNKAESEREMLQRQQEAELARVRSASGLSRVEIEDKIKKVQDQIFQEEEDNLEPAQERIRAAEYKKQLDIDALTVSGKTRTVWDQIANSTDIASQNTEKFAESIKRALALYEYFVNGKALDLSLFGDDEMDELIEIVGGPEKLAKAIAEQDPVPEPAPTPTGGGGGGGGGGSKSVLEALREAETKDPTVVQANKDIASANKTIEALKNSPGNKSIVDAMYKQKADAAYTKSWALKAVATAAGADLVPKSSTPSGGQYKALQDSKKTTTTTTRRRTTPIPAKSSPVVSSGSDRKFSNYIPPKKTTTPKRFITVGGQKIYYNSGGMVPGYSIGGAVKGYSLGGMFKSRGSDNIPAMLTPGEYVIRKRAVQDFGAKNLESINNGTYTGGSVYNYNLAVNVKSDADPDKIARTVMKQIQRVDAQKVRGNRI